MRRWRKRRELVGGGSTRPFDGLLLGEGHPRVVKDFEKEGESERGSEEEERAARSRTETDSGCSALLGLGDGRRLMNCCKAAGAYVEALTALISSPEKELVGESLRSSALE